MSEKLESYRPTMANDVLHSWASDAQAELARLRECRDRWKSMCTQAWNERDDTADSLECAEAELARLRAELAEWHKLRDPANLHVSLLRGFPAQLSRATYLHLAGGNVVREALIEIRDRIKEHPAYAELTEDDEIAIGGDAAELSYLARVADDALAQEPPA